MLTVHGEEGGGGEDLLLTSEDGEVLIGEGEDLIEEEGVVLRGEEEDWREEGEVCMRGGEGEDLRGEEVGDMTEEVGGEEGMQREVGIWILRRKMWRKDSVT